ncbi:protein RGF1 INDUCIBLE TRANSCRIPTION FACTOR 1-like [Andrographis paniculata]|uniref:protein RGF1 INDUCIBLE TRANSCRIPTION FACTOR 1-like n=1 Tax=Andrographis paniculata TaxID=175694 RepID=UPI0021E6E2A9|nr:protein RGF1 INDUCIBLE TRANSCRIPTION FACTOR 1-like [Andrographis paniculata]
MCMPNKFQTHKDKEKTKKKDTAMVDATPEIPRWLSALLTEKFFNACIVHEDSRKNEKNVFCLDCSEGICPDCFANHNSHRLLQIRRYVYHDVIRVVDADKLMDCAQVQSYTTNSAKVVFLNQRPLTRPPRASGNVCITCDRNLQDSYLFCSISCKVHHILRSGDNLSAYLRKCEFLALPDDGAIPPDSGDSGSSAGEVMDCPNLTCTATTDVVKKKRSNLPACRSGFRPSCWPASDMSESIMNRRKGTPHRSPMH